MKTQPNAQLQTHLVFADMGIGRDIYVHREWLVIERYNEERGCRELVFDETLETVLCVHFNVVLSYLHISGLRFIGSHRGDSVSRWTTLSCFQICCLSCKCVQALNVSMEVHPCAAGLLEARA